MFRTPPDDISGASNFPPPKDENVVIIEDIIETDPEDNSNILQDNSAFKATNILRPTMFPQSDVLPSYDSLREEKWRKKLKN